MTSPPVTIPSHRTVDEASHLMAHLAVRHLLVVDDDGVLVGVISDRDLRGPLSRSGRRPPTGPPPDVEVSAVMSRHLVTARAAAELAEVAALMLEHAIGAVPIVDDRGAPVGVVTTVDALRSLAAEPSAPK